ncbi:MAG TPA: nuclear transport factor 2 family protein [Steroidobacteraceae bacterium]|nr:nuclear transport factor 2 family protein [Steroidobacteraceae bacterium]
MPSDANRDAGQGRALTAAGMEAAIRAYFASCNSGDIERIAAHFEPDGVHFFPPGMYEGPFRGAYTIARKWHDAVRELGSVWTVDQVICDPPGRRAVIEWSHFKRRAGVLLRGDEWYVFSPRGLIEEIRAYYASPQDASLRRLELAGFDYAGRGYSMTDPDA